MNRVSKKWLEPKWLEPKWLRTHPQWFLEDVEYDDTALEEMLHEVHREQIYRSVVVVVHVRANGAIRWRANKASN